MRILFLTHYFPPEANAPAARTSDHCRRWVRAGHEVHVVTCVPSHPRGEPFAGYQRGWYRFETMDGVNVHRVWTYLAPNRGTARRSLGFVSFVPSAVFRASRLGRFDIAIATSPHLFCAAAGYLTGAIKGTPWVFELRDLWPEAIAALGSVRSSLALKALEKLELYLYRESAGVVCLTRSFADDLTSRGIDPGKLEYVPNGVDLDFWKRGDRQKVRKDLGFADEDVVAGYIGTVGMAYGLSTVLEAAKALRDTRPGIKFLIVGDGAELDNLEKRALEEGLSNLVFTGLVPRPQVPDYMAAVDISLVLHRDLDVFKAVMSSKMLESMAAARPIVLGARGETKAVLDRANSGVCIQPGNAKELSCAIVELADDPKRRAKMGSSGQKLVSREFDRDRLADKYLAILERLQAHHAPSRPTE